MRPFEELYAFTNDASMTLVINNNSKPLMNSLYNIIYNKYTSPKCKVAITRKLMLKISKINNKLIRHESDLSKIQFSSTKNNGKVRSDFNDLKLILSDNNSKMLFKFDITAYKICYNELDDLKEYLRKLISQYDVFDLIILIDKNDIKILKYERNNFSLNNYINDNVFNMDRLLRSVKLRKIKLRNEKES
jgi:hypothetical protein